MLDYTTELSAPFDILYQFYPVLQLSRNGSTWPEMNRNLELKQKNEDADTIFSIFRSI